MLMPVAVWQELAVWSGSGLVAALLLQAPGLSACLHPRVNGTITGCGG